MTHFGMFHAHIALALQLIALVAGCLLLSQSAKGEFFYKKMGQWVGALVVIVSFLSIICIAVLTIRNACHEKEAKMESMMWQHPPIDWSKQMQEMKGMEEKKK